MAFGYEVDVVMMMSDEVGSFQHWYHRKTCWNFKELYIRLGIIEDLAELAIVEALKRQVTVAGSLASVG